MLKMQAAYTRLRVGTHDLKLFMQISCSEHVVRSYYEAMSVPKPKVCSFESFAGQLILHILPNSEA